MEGQGTNWVQVNDDKKTGRAFQRFVVSFARFGGAES
jgi:hypothetical protein